MDDEQQEFEVVCELDAMQAEFVEGAQGSPLRSAITNAQFESEAHCRQQLVNTDSHHLAFASLTSNGQSLDSMVGIGDVISAHGLGALLRPGDVPSFSGTDSWPSLL